MLFYIRIRYGSSTTSPIIKRKHLKGWVEALRSHYITAKSLEHIDEDSVHVIAALENMVLDHYFLFWKYKTESINIQGN